MMGNYSIAFRTRPVGSNGSFQDKVIDLKNVEKSEGFEEYYVAVNEAIRQLFDAGLEPRLPMKVTQVDDQGNVVRATLRKVN